MASSLHQQLSGPQAQAKQSERCGSGFTREGLGEFTVAFAGNPPQVAC